MKEIAEQAEMIRLVKAVVANGQAALQLENGEYAIVSASKCKRIFTVTTKSNEQKFFGYTRLLGFLLANVRNYLANTSNGFELPILDWSQIPVPEVFGVQLRNLFFSVDHDLIEEGMNSISVISAEYDFKSLESEFTGRYESDAIKFASNFDLINFKEGRRLKLTTLPARTCFNGNEREVAAHLDSQLNDFLCDFDFVRIHLDRNSDLQIDTAIPLGYLTMTDQNKIVETLIEAQGDQIASTIGKTAIFLN